VTLSTKLKTQLLHDPAISLLRIYTIEMNTYICTKRHKMVTGTLYTLYS
jgi:hypothetical protein